VTPSMPGPETLVSAVVAVSSLAAGRPSDVDP